MEKIEKFKLENLRENSLETYEVEIRINDDSMMKGLLEFEAVVRKTKDEHGNKVTNQESEPAKVKMDPVKRKGVVTYGQIERDFELPDLQGFREPEDPRDGQPEDFSDAGAPSFVEAVKPVEEFFLDCMEYVPAGDPIFGCLVKAGVTSTIGQSLRCRNLHRQHDDKYRSASWRQKAQMITDCLWEHRKEISGRALKRALKCVARGGF